MKLFMHLISSLFVIAAAHGQEEAETIYQRAAKIETDRFIPKEDNNILNINSSFSKDTLRQIPFTDQRIVKISLVYTEFSEDIAFDQVALDKRRIRHLIDLNPQVAANQFIQWSLIEQTGCKSYRACHNFFHGFVIEYAPYPTKEMTILEIDSVKNELKRFYTSLNQNPEDLSITFEEIPCAYPKFSYSDDIIDEQLDKYYKCNQNYKARVFFTAQVDYLGRPTAVKVNGYQYECEEFLAHLLTKILKWERGLVIGNQQFGLEVKGSVQFPLKSGSIEFLKYNFPENLITKHRIIRSYPKCLAYAVDTSFQKVLTHLEKTAVFNVLERNTTKPKAFVVDATASMYPYTTDLLKWVKVMPAEAPLKYVFFNDGDDKKTNDKWIGSTGGIYTVFTKNFNEVKNTLFESMKNGGGGDLQENNIEALLSLNAGSDTVIMIADNLSFPRDIELLDQFKGHLSVILCGTKPGVNTNYLDLGRRYNVSLHTSSSDLDELGKVEIGEIISIDGYKYQLTYQGFEQVYR